MVLPVFPRNIYRARPKSPPFQFFSALRDIFFGFFFLKGSPLHFFMFCDRMDVGKSQRVPPFSFFGIVRFYTENKKFFFNFFMFCDRMDVEKPQRVPPFSFSALWDVSAPGARGSEPRRATRSIFLVCNFFKKKISKNFQFSTTVNEYLTLGSLFAIFEPWIWRRLGPVPACLMLFWITTVI